MANSTVQFVTQMKLRELNRQRDKLREAYRQLGEKMGQASRPQDRLRLLYDGLRDLKFAGRPLHPEVANLEILFYQIETGALSPEVLALWLKRLEDELAAGRLRSEFVYLFGALLEEWTREEPEDPGLAEEREQAQKQLLEKALSAPEPNLHHTVLDSLFDSLNQEERNDFASVEQEIGKPVEESELTSALEQIVGNIYQSPRIRREAKQFGSNAVLKQELSDALTILISDLPAWDWPEMGLEPRTQWTRNKWRLYLKEDLPNVCLLEIVARRFIRARKEQKLLNHLVRGYPTSLSPNSCWEIGQDASGSEEPEKYRGGSCIAQARESHLARQQELGTKTGADYEEEQAGNQAVSLIHAEIQLTRAAFPNRPIFVVKLDLKDYYASIPHDVLLTVMRQFGLTEQAAAFLTKFLTPPLQSEEQHTMRMQRGVSMGYVLSDVLAEMLMRLLEVYVLQERQVRIVRLVDDICILTSRAEDAVAAWRHVEAFCAACGLQINPEKSGAVCLGGTLPAELPQALPRWGMLELNADGQWQVNQEAFEAHREQSRKHMIAEGPVLSRVQQYNANARFLTSGLSFGLALGKTHRAAVTDAVKQFHLDFFGPGKGIAQGLCADIRDRFQRNTESSEGIPEAWLYWPITAGGLGLLNPVVVAGQYQESYEHREMITVPDKRPPQWNLEYNEWFQYYAELLDTLDLEDPEETKSMESLIADFIERGADISAGQQKGLTPYWRWILSMYGPQILEKFGTFRFLITELVPLQLISLQRLQDTSLDSATQASDTMENADPFQDE